jgi:hypothetical protein
VRAGVDIGCDIAVETGDTTVDASNNLNGRFHAENVAEKSMNQNMTITQNVIG